ncbi:LysE family translocator [Shimia sp.]|uniref:LysE family translocator n=1 Tax=Shimia sp. TaxID=1954381 RepID=UPI0032985E09
MIETFLNMDPVTIATFLMAGIVLNLTPGADVVFATASGISGGWRFGVAAAFGIALGAVVHITLAAVGISAALMALPWAYDAIRYLGAAYLLYLAVKSWRAPPETGNTQGAKGARQAIRRGFLTNLMNPKVALFVLAFLPQFTALEAGPVWHQILILGGLFTVTVFFITAAYGAAAGIAGTALRGASGLMNKISAIVFGGLAAKLVMD